MLNVDVHVAQCHGPMHRCDLFHPVLVVFLVLLVSPLFTLILVGRVHILDIFK